MTYYTVRLNEKELMRVINAYSEILVCPFCGRKFKNKGTFYKHVQTHLNEFSI